MGPEPMGEVVPEQGSLYCLQADRSVTTHREKVNISNGLAWTADQKTMYYIDSLQLGVDAYDYDVATGVISRYILCLKLRLQTCCLCFRYVDGIKICRINRI